MTSAVACFQLQFSDLLRPSLEPRSTEAISTNRDAPQKMSAEKLHRALVSEPIINNMSTAEEKVQLLGS